MSDAGRKRCIVVFALPERQSMWEIELPVGATIAQALDEAQRVSGQQDVPWDSADVGIFGELRDRTDVPRDGDRIELYRPLKQDPKESRRDRVSRLRADTRRSRR